MDCKFTALPLQQVALNVRKLSFAKSAHFVAFTSLYLQPTYSSWAAKSKFDYQICSFQKGLVISNKVNEIHQLQHKDMRPDKC